MKPPDIHRNSVIIKQMPLRIRQKSRLKLRSLQTLCTISIEMSNRAETVRNATGQSSESKKKMKNKSHPISYLTNACT